MRLCLCLVGDYVVTDIIGWVPIIVQYQPWRAQAFTHHAVAQKVVELGTLAGPLTKVTYRNGFVVVIELGDESPVCGVRWSFNLKEELVDLVVGLNDSPKHAANLMVVRRWASTRPGVR